MNFNRGPFLYCQSNDFSCLSSIILLMSLEIAAKLTASGCDVGAGCCVLAICLWVPFNYTGKNIDFGRQTRFISHYSSIMLHKMELCEALSRGRLYQRFPTQVVRSPTHTGLLFYSNPPDLLPAFLITWLGELKLEVQKRHDSNGASGVTSRT